MFPILSGRMNFSHPLSFVSVKHSFPRHLFSSILAFLVFDYLGFLSCISFYPDSFSPSIFPCLLPLSTIFLFKIVSSSSSLSLTGVIVLPLPRFHVIIIFFIQPYAYGLHSLHYFPFSFCRGPSFLSFPLTISSDQFNYSDTLQFVRHGMQL